MQGRIAGSEIKLVERGKNTHKQIRLEMERNKDPQRIRECHDKSEVLEILTLKKNVKQFGEEKAWNMQAHQVIANLDNVGLDLVKTDTLTNCLLVLFT